MLAAKTQIIAETPELHAEAIEALYDLTFGPGHFAKTAERLREYNKSLTGISRIAVCKGQIIAAVRVWPVRAEIGGLALFVGPVAVHPDARGHKLGLKLTSEAMIAGKRAGWIGAILIGAPEYFAEIGFRQMTTDQLSFPGPQDQARVLVADLAGNAALYAGNVKAAMQANGGHSDRTQSSVPKEESTKIPNSSTS